MRDFPLFPEQASTFAGQVDLLYWVLIGLSLIFGGVLPFIILYLMVRYHRSNQRVDRTNQVHSNLPLELTWSIIPLFLVMGVFFWGAFLFVQMRTPPARALEVYVIGKQWMWHAQHPNGKRENNELHVPIGRQVKLIMTSQDVIHSFYIPAFRVKQDVLPGRYTTMWFEATREGEYHLFCAEYCGTEHARMGGRVVVMSAAAYEQWLVTPGEVILPDGSAGSALPVPQPGQDQGDPMALVGGQLFANLGCASCHRDDGAGAGPSLVNLYGNQERLVDGSSVLVDENYLAESILNPQARVVDGYQPIMPSYDGQLSADQVNQLIAYIKSLSDAGAQAATPEPSPQASGPTAEGTAAPAATAAPTATTAPTASSTPAAALATATAAPAASGGFDAALAAQGDQVFANLGCASCHNSGVGPALQGLYNSERPLADGSTITADEAYLIESILNSQARVAEGYQPIMPPYQGQISDDQLAQLVEYIKSLGN